MTIILVPGRSGEQKSQVLGQNGLHSKIDKQKSTKQQQQQQQTEGEVELPGKDRVWEPKKPSPEPDSPLSLHQPLKLALFPPGLAHTVTLLCCDRNSMSVKNEDLGKVAESVYLGHEHPRGLTGRIPQSH